MGTRLTEISILLVAMFTKIVHYSIVYVAILKYVMYVYNFT